MLRHREQGPALVAKVSPPPTCPKCMGRGTLSETKDVWGADEKGLPVKNRITSIIGCGRCSGKGTV